MRSRYAAYVLGNIDYIEKTHNPNAREEVDRKGAEEWSKQATWDGLEIHTSSEEGDEGVVEFTARYIVQGRLFRHRERAEFKRMDGKWRYMDGEMVKGKPVVRDTPKVGRNEPCPCGSGKKFMKCHANKPDELARIINAEGDPRKRKG